MRFAMQSSARGDAPGFELHVIHTRRTDSRGWQPTHLEVAIEGGGPATIRMRLWAHRVCANAFMNRSYRIRPAEIPILKPLEQQRELRSQHGPEIMRP